MVKSANFLTEISFKAVKEIPDLCFDLRGNVPKFTLLPYFRTIKVLQKGQIPNLHYDHILEQSKYYKMVKSANLFRQEISFYSSYNFKFKNNQSTTKWSNQQIFLDRRFIFRAVRILNSRTYVLTSEETFPNLHYYHILEQSKYYKMVKSANLFRPEISFYSSYNFKFKNNQSTTKWSNRQIFLDRRFLFKAVTILNSRTHILTFGETFPNLHYDHILEQSKYYKMVKSANHFRPEIYF
ncbi:hypothetical protein Avbf_11118 [Armadillidium vulgare]|nr:hypothetical protein Avbf_11118 [Armadillidium vulgare]